MRKISMNNSITSLTYAPKYRKNTEAIFTYCIRLMRHMRTYYSNCIARLRTPAQETPLDRGEKLRRGTGRKTSTYTIHEYIYPQIIHHSISENPPLSMVTHSVIFFCTNHSQVFFQKSSMHIFKVMTWIRSHMNGGIFLRHSPLYSRI